MQLSGAVPILLLWLQVATAAPVLLVPRQADVIGAAISKVMTSLQNLDGAINNVGPDLNSALPLLDQVQATQKTLNEAGQDIKSSKRLRLLESAGLLQPAMGLMTMVKTTLGDLTQKKPVFDQLGVSSTVADAVKQQKTAASSLTDGLVSKLPRIAQDLAGAATGDLTGAFDSTIQAFEAPPTNAPAAALPAPVPSPPTPPALTAPAAPVAPVAPITAPAAPAVPAVPAAVAAPARPAVPAALSGGATTATQ